MLEPCLLCAASCPRPAGSIFLAVLIKGRTFATFAPDFGVQRVPEAIRSLQAVLEAPWGSPPKPRWPQPETSRRTEIGEWRTTWEGVPGIRSSPGFSNIEFEIRYLCKQGLCSKSLVRAHAAICASDQVIENWSHFCKLCNKQEEGGSVTPGCGKETSSGIRHKAGLQQLQLQGVRSRGGNLGGDGLPVARPKEKKAPPHNGSILKCVLISCQPRPFLVL